MYNGIGFLCLCIRPPEESYEDWLAVHVVDFFNRIQLLYVEVIADTCTEESCPIMSGGPKYEYLWKDGEKFKVNCL